MELAHMPPIGESADKRFRKHVSTKCDIPLHHIQIHPMAFRQRDAWKQTGCERVQSLYPIGRAGSKNELQRRYNVVNMLIADSQPYASRSNVIRSDRRSNGLAVARVEMFDSRKG